jgi:hypothetical protein
LLDANRVKIAEMQEANASYSFQRGCWWNVHSEASSGGDTMRIPLKFWFRR